jgi:hypothetical protein
VSLTPSSSDAERAHMIVKSNRTKKRNRLLYTNNLALSFAKAELQAERTKPGFTWKELFAMHAKTREVSDEEFEELDALDRRWAAENAKSEEDNEAAESAEEQEGDAQEPGESPETSTPVVARRSRVRKPKRFDDFVRLDDDGGVGF